MNFDEWRVANYDSDWSDRDYARAAWNASALNCGEKCADRADDWWNRAKDSKLEYDIVRAAVLQNMGAEFGVFRKMKA